MGQRQRRLARERGDRKFPWESVKEFEKRQKNPRVRRMRNRKPPGSTLKTRAAEQSVRDKAAAEERAKEGMRARRRVRKALKKGDPIGQIAVEATPFA